MTDAGKQLAGILQVNGRDDPAMLDYIAAIEAEAVAAERARIRAGVKELAETHGHSTGHGRYVWAQSVLAIIDGADDA
jgi:hypothetical protein